LELPNADSSLLVVGDIGYDHPPYEQMPEFVNPQIVPRNVALPQWSRLPGTRDEMYSIRDLWEKRRENPPCKLLPGRLATEDVLRRANGGPRWLHIATHGFYADDLRPSYVSTLPDSPSDAAVSLAASWNLASIHPNLLSGLVLAGANRPTVSPNDDGLWTAREVAELDLRDTELVVLSACETGLGEFRRGEGLLGLRRAFHSAGARNVMASLWKVDDEATRRLMVQFYEHLWNRKLPKAEALRQAQIAMLQGNIALPPGVLRGADPIVDPADGAATTPDGRLPPFYWAAFALSGDGR
jgi:CHAT domain-containing protein